MTKNFWVSGSGARLDGDDSRAGAAALCSKTRAASSNRIPPRLLMTGSALPWHVLAWIFVPLHLPRVQGFPFYILRVSRRIKKSYLSLGEAWKHVEQCRTILTSVHLIPHCLPTSPSQSMSSLPFQGLSQSPNCSATHSQSNSGPLTMVVESPSGRTCHHTMFPLRSYWVAGFLSGRL